MRPRPRGRGIALEAIQGQFVGLASMRPRPRGRGIEDPKGHPLSDIELQ